MWRGCLLTALLGVLLSGCPDEPVPRNRARAGRGPSWRRIAPRPCCRSRAARARTCGRWGRTRAAGRWCCTTTAPRGAELATGYRGDLWWVHAFEQGPVLMAGANATILRYENGQFTRMSTPGLARHTVYGVWGARPDDVYAVGSVSGPRRLHLALRREDLAGRAAAVRGHAAHAGRRYARPLQGVGHGPGRRLRGGGPGHGAALAGRRRLRAARHGHHGSALHRARRGRHGGGGGRRGPGRDPRAERARGSSSAKSRTGARCCRAWRIARGWRPAGPRAARARCTAAPQGGRGRARSSGCSSQLESLHATWVDPEGGVWAVGGNVLSSGPERGRLLQRGAGGGHRARVAGTAPGTAAGRARTAQVDPKPTGSIARRWDEQILGAIRRDLPRPTVHARNLYHLSAAMWDAWAAYDATADGVFVREKLTASDVAAGARGGAELRRLPRAHAPLYPGAWAARCRRRASRAFMQKLGYDPDATGTDGDEPSRAGQPHRPARSSASARTTAPTSRRTTRTPRASSSANPPLVVDDAG